MASDSADVRAEIPLACTLSADEMRARRVENASLFARAQGLHELPDGYRFAFLADGNSAQDLLAFILAEAACCPFFTFELTFPSPHQSVWLTVRGQEGVKEIVRTGWASQLPAPTSAVAGAVPTA